MTPALWFEFLAPCGPLVASLAVGFACVGWDGEVYLTRSGAAYLAERGET